MAIDAVGSWGHISYDRGYVSAFGVPTIFE